MIEFSKIGFYLFSGALGATGIAAASGALDMPPRGSFTKPPAIAAKAVSGSGEMAKSEAKNTANDDTKTASLTPEKSSPEGPEGKVPEVSKPVYPVFHLVTVENGTSTLIAGNTAPASIVEILDGEKIVATTTSGSNGDFVAILEQPLTPGDHSLTIRATDQNNEVLVSKETSLISIPDDKNGEVLVMVTKPGEASRILNNPAVAKGAKENVTDKKNVEIASAEVPASQQKAEPSVKQAAETVDTNSGNSGSTGEARKPEMASADANDSKKAPEMAVKSSTMQTPETANVSKPEEQASTETAQSGGKKADVKTSAPPAKKSATTETSVEKPSMPTASEVAAKEPAPEALADKEVAAVEPAAKGVVAKESVAKEPEAKAPVAKKPVETPPTIIVEAVEVEAGRMFVAGAAEPGRRIAIYVDNQFLGFTTGTREGRFLIETERNLAPGNHVVRADIFDKSGTNIASRVEVPLVHEPREPVVVAKANPEQASQEQGTAKADDATTKTAVPEKTESAAKAKSDQMADVTVAKKSDDNGNSPKMNKQDEAAANPVVAKPQKTGETEVEKTATKDNTAAMTKNDVKPEKPEMAAKPTGKSEVMANSANTQPPAADDGAGKVANVAETNPKSATSVSKKEKTEVQIAAVAPKMDKKPAKSDKPAMKTEPKPTAVSKPETTVEKQAVSKPQKPETTKSKAVAAQTSPVAKEAMAPASEVSKSNQPSVSPPANSPSNNTKVASVGNTTTQPVIRTGASVIIRRGDSLWRISYRTYGRGIRYSTIYNANLNQLRSPHRIYPGQILKVPKMKSKEQG